MPPAAASSAPRITSPGALSPPSASTATRVMAGRLRSLEAERLDLAALVRAAGRADAVRALRRPALRADIDARRLDRMRGAALVATGLRGFPLRDGHEPRQCSRTPALVQCCRPLSRAHHDGSLDRNRASYRLSI